MITRKLQKDNWVHILLESIFPVFFYFKLEAPMVIVNNKDIEEQVSVMKSWFSGYETGTVG